MVSVHTSDTDDQYRFQSESDKDTTFSSYTSASQSHNPYSAFHKFYFLDIFWMFSAKKPNFLKFPNKKSPKGELNKCNLTYCTSD